MGITKQYLRYKSSGKCSVIGSTWARLTSLRGSSRGDQLCAVGACEDVLLWNLRKAEKVYIFTLCCLVLLLRCRF